jgi:hypothetical protein
MVRVMSRELPPEFLDGIEGIDVSPKAVPDPIHAGVYTLGECVPHAFGHDDEGPRLRSRIVLYYGSFAALARTSAGFDWRHEAWETLTHELRHHLEWRARVPALEALDDAVEANYARLGGEPFPPLFHLDGERIGPGVTKVEDDIFFDVLLGTRAWRAAAGASREVVWHGRRHVVRLPAELPDVLFLALEGLTPEPAGEVVLVVRRRPGARDLWHRTVVRAAAGMVQPPLD